MVLLVKKGRTDPLGLPATLVAQGRRETRGPRAGMVPLEPREREARTAFRESAVRLDPEDSEEGLDVLEVLVLLDPRETLDSLGLPDQWESRVFLDQRAPEDLLERLDCRAFLGRMDPPDRQEREVHLENMDRLDHRETLE